MNSAERERLFDLMVVFLEGGAPLDETEQEFVRNMARLHPHDVYSVFQEVMEC